MTGEKEEEDEFDGGDLPDYGPAPDKDKLRQKPRGERVAKRRIRIKPARKKSNEAKVAGRSS